MSSLRARLRPVACFVIAACAAPRAPAPSTASAPWSYEVQVRDGANVLDVAAAIMVDAAQDLVVDGDARPYVGDLAVENGSARGESVTCDPPRCVVRYRFRLRDAARALRDTDTAAAFGEAYAAPPTAWLLHPSRATTPAYRVRLASGGGAVLSGIPAVAADTFEANDAGLDDAPLFAFGDWRRRSVGAITIGIAPSPRAMDDDAIARWTDASYRTVTRYLDASPLARPLLLFVPGERDVIDGKTLGGGGGSILINLGDAVSDRVARESWVLVHEMIHLELPSLGPPHQWLEEGIATYVEPIARARAGALTAERVWADLARDAAKGLPREGDRGLEQTHTWERTYWGGAVFCLSADVEIRRRTGNRRSLDDALRAIARGSRGVAERWAIERYLDVGDAATGTRVLHEHFERLARAPGSVDLDAIWRSLGIARDGDRLTFDDRAPLADIRRAITSP